MHGAFAANQNRNSDGPADPRQLLRCVFAVRQNLTSEGLSELMIDKFGLALLCFEIVSHLRGDRDMDAKKYAAEAIGTFWLTFAGCGGAVIAPAFGVRAERRDDGLCHRSRVRLPSQPRRYGGPRRGRPFSGGTDRRM
jgi:hypothetical protein